MARDCFLGNGDQTFRSTEPDWDPQGSRVFGGNGDDDISVFGFDLVLNGGNGDDAVGAAGFGNLALGGNGDDWVGANGRGNILDGGRGEDALLSVAGGGTYEVAQGNIMTGGPGADTFIPSSSSDLVVTNDGGDGTVSEGDIVAGVLDVIPPGSPKSASTRTSFLRRTSTRPPPTTSICCCSPASTRSSKATSRRPGSSR
jgi:hypothetical protein